MKPLEKGRYVARIAQTHSDILRAQKFRARCFGLASDRDSDPFDADCQHVLIEEVSDGVLVCTFRMLSLAGGAVMQGYSGQFYDLSPLAGRHEKVVELGRFCVDPACRDADILRVAWAAITAYVDETHVDLLIGCSSFAGIEASRYSDSFALLKAYHLAAPDRMPRIKAREVFRFAARLRRKPDAAKALRQMPPLLRSYLAMGGRVSDHAVVDRQMNTLHVFTAVEIGAIPDSRKRALRAVL